MSNPSFVVSAWSLLKNAYEHGLRARSHVFIYSSTCRLSVAAFRIIRRFFRRFARRTVSHVRACREKLIRPRSNINIYAKNNTYTDTPGPRTRWTFRRYRGAGVYPPSRNHTAVNWIIRPRAPENGTNPFDFRRRSRRKSLVSLRKLASERVRNRPARPLSRGTRPNVGDASNVGSKTVYPVRGGFARRNARRHAIVTTPPRTATCSVQARS